MAAPNPRRPRFIAGGDDETEEQQQPREPTRPRYPCVAHNCPMPGSIFLSGSSQGICGWHYGTNSDDWSRITEVILGPWREVAREINAARRALSDQDLCTNVKVLGERYRDAAQRLAQALTGPLAAELAPREKEDYGQWYRRLELFLGSRVAEVVRRSAGRAA